MVSSKKLLEILQILSQLRKNEKADFVRYLHGLQDSADNLVLPSSYKVTTKE